FDLLVATNPLWDWCAFAMRFNCFQFLSIGRKTSTMKSMILFAVIAAAISTGAYALRSDPADSAATGAAAKCKCGDNCKCDPCECPKTDAVALAACKCGEDCKCDPCKCPKTEAVALAACKCGE